jgi:phosphatidylserine/phosphatidylglycerophosphate/cardiolipin synthase-like enzyme
MHPLGKRLLLHALKLELPVFKISPNDIHILHTPQEFYDSIQTGIKKAQKRITISTLYLGTTEQALVSQHLFVYSLLIVCLHFDF